MVKRLEADEAFTRPQAERLAEAVHAAMHEDLVNKADLTATETALKADTATLRTDLRADTAAFRTEVKTEFTSVRSELKATEIGIRSDMKVMEQSLRSEMKVTEHALKFWVGSIAVALFTGLGGLMTFLLRLYH